MNRLNSEYERIIKNLNLTEGEICSNEECAEYYKLLEDGKSLPDGIKQSPVNKYVFLKSNSGDVTQKDIDRLMWLLLCKDVSAIKKCAIFFAVVLALQIAFGLWLGIRLMPLLS